MEALSVRDRAPCTPSPGCQVVDRAWHIPIRDSQDCSGDKWLCIDLMVGLESRAHGFSDRQGIET